MKFVSAISLIALLVGKHTGLSQSFVNLDFESAQIVLDASGPHFPPAIFVSSALPGWIVYHSGIPFDTNDFIYYDDAMLGASFLSIHDTNDSFLTPLQANYSMLIQGEFLVSRPPISFAIGQTG